LWSNGSQWRISPSAIIEGTIGPSPCTAVGNSFFSPGGIVRYSSSRTIVVSCPSSDTKKEVAPMTGAFIFGFLSSDSACGRQDLNSLTGTHAILEPLSLEHHDDLVKATRDGELWRL
jgi:hypothetical protein